MLFQILLSQIWAMIHRERNVSFCSKVHPIFYFFGFTENDERVRSDSAKHQLPDAVPIQVLQSLHL